MSKADPVEVQRLYRAGEKLDAIAARFGVSKQRVHQIALELGEPKRRGPRALKAPKVTRYGQSRHAERNKRVIEAWAAGRAFAKIAMGEGISTTCAKAIVARWGRA